MGASQSLYRRGFAVSGNNMLPQAFSLVIQVNSKGRNKQFHYKIVFKKSTNYTRIFYYNNILRKK